MENRATKWTWTALFFVIAILLLQPFFDAGFFHDDIINGFLSFRLNQSGQSLWTEILKSNREWMFGNARFFPVAHVLEAPTYYYLMNNLLTYRVLTLSFILINLFLFIKIIAHLTKNSWLGLLGGMLALLCFQARAYFDAMTGFGCLLEYVCFFGFGSILFLLHYKEKKRPIYLILSLLFHVCAILSYEAAISFSFTLFFVMIDWKALKNHRWKELVPNALHFVLFAIYLSICFYLRSKYSIKYDGTQVHFSERNLRTFFNQFSGAFPLTYAAFARSGIFKWTMFKSLLSIQYLVYFIGLTLFIRQTVLRIKGGKAGQLFSYGLFLVLLPPALICLSPKYQEQLERPGMAYLPVYLSYFGAALWILGLVVFIISKKKSRKPSWIWPTVMSFLLIVNTEANQISVSFFNGYLKYPRILFEKAVQSKIFSEIPDHSVILFTPNFTSRWMIQPLLEKAAKRPLQFSNLDAFAVSHENNKEYLKTMPVYYISMWTETLKKDSYLILSRVREIKKNSVFAEGPIQIIVKDNPSPLRLIYGKKKSPKSEAPSFSLDFIELEDGWKKALLDLPQEPVNTLLLQKL